MMPFEPSECKVYKRPSFAEAMVAAVHFFEGDQAVYRDLLAEQARKARVGVDLLSHALSGSPLLSLLPGFKEIDADRYHVPLSHRIADLEW